MEIAHEPEEADPEHLTVDQAVSAVSTPESAEPVQELEEEPLKQSSSPISGRKLQFQQPKDSFWIDSFHHPFLELDSDWCLLSPVNNELVTMKASAKQIIFYKDGKIATQLPDIEDIVGAKLFHGKNADTPLLCYASGELLVEVDLSSNSIMHKMTLSPLNPHDMEKKLFETFISTNFPQKAIDEDSAKNQPLQLPISLESFMKNLADLQFKTPLSSFSKALIKTFSEDKSQVRLQMFADFDMFHLTQPRFITDLTTLKRYQGVDLKDEYWIAGTESRHVLVVDPSSHSIVKEFSMKHAISLISAIGCFEVQYSIFAVLRDNSMHCINNGKISLIYVFSGIPLFLLCIGQLAIVACNDMNVYAFSSNGKLMFTIQENNQITSICPIYIRERNTEMFAIGMADKTIKIYKNDRLASTVLCEDIPMSLVFGRFAGENHCLVIVGLNGGVSVKMLKRTAVFEIGQTMKGIGPAVEQEIPLKIPSKTRLYLSEMERQKREAESVFNAFETSMDYVKKQVKSVYEKALAGSLHMKASSSQSHINIRISTEVFGIGPLYKIRCTISHNEESEAYHDLKLILTSDCAQISMPIISLPLIAPDRMYNFNILAKVNESAMEQSSKLVAILLVQQSDLISSCLVNLDSIS